jgi:YaiO family outer membrane protein
MIPSNRCIWSRLCCAAVSLCLFSLRIAAQQTVASTNVPAQDSSERQTGSPAPVQPVPEKILTNYIEAGGSYEQLSNNFGRWSGGYARGVYALGANTINAEINGEHEFGDAGVYMDAGDTHTFNSDWYGSVNLGSSVGGVFWPRFRVDTFLNRKLLARKQLIATGGFTYDHAKDVHSDHTVFLGTTYYFQKLWIVEDGVRFNISNPGTVFAPSGFVAVTEGVNKHHYVTLNLQFGQEAYQVIGETSVLSRFDSQTASVTWRQWLGKNWGFDLVGDYYHNPYYHRGGGSFGFFKEF